MTKDKRKYADRAEYLKKLLFKDENSLDNERLNIKVIDVLFVNIINV